MIYEIPVPGVLRVFSSLGIRAEEALTINRPALFPDPKKQRGSF